MSFVTDDFIDRTVLSGDLTLAQARVMNGTAQPRLESFGAFGNWSLICEELLDTEHDPGHYDRIVRELRHRGVDDNEMNRMRRFAWKTAGWLNFDRLLWEDLQMGESHIRKSLELQLRDGLIRDEQYVQGLAFLAKHADASERRWK